MVFLLMTFEIVATSEAIVAEATAIQLGTCVEDEMSLEINHSDETFLATRFRTDVREVVLVPFFMIRTRAPSAKLGRAETTLELDLATFSMCFNVVIFQFRA